MNRELVYAYSYGLHKAIFIFFIATLHLTDSLTKSSVKLTKLIHTTTFHDAFTHNNFH